MLNDQLVSNFGLNLSGTLEYLSFPEHYPLTLVFRSDHGQEGNHIKKKLTVCKYHIYSICCYSVEYIDLAKAKSGARIFFSCTSQGHNALPRPGLEPRLSDSEPSALTTGWTTEH